MYLKDQSTNCTEYGWNSRAQNNNQKPPKTWNTVCNEYPATSNPTQSLQENPVTVFRTLFYDSLPKNIRDMRSFKTAKFKLEI